MSTSLLLSLHSRELTIVPHSVFSSMPTPLPADNDSLFDSYIDSNAYLDQSFVRIAPPRANNLDANVY